MGDLNHVAYLADDFDRGLLVGQRRNFAPRSIIFAGDRILEAIPNGQTTRALLSGSSAVWRPRLDRCLTAILTSC